MAKTKTLELGSIFEKLDTDGDGLGDNPNGNNPDPSLDDTDNDGYINQNDAFITISDCGQVGLHHYRFWVDAKKHLKK